MSVQRIALLIVVLFSLLQSAFVNAYGESVFSCNDWSRPIKYFKSSPFLNNYGSYISFMYGYKYGETLDVHGGVDIDATEGENVYAIDDGIVKRIDRSSSGVQNLSIIFIEHQTESGIKFLALYGHVYANRDLKVGNRISQNSYLGYVVRYSPKKYTHLHFAISYNTDDYKNSNWGGITGGITDPLSFLANNHAGKSEPYSKNLLREISVRCQSQTLSVFNSMQCTLTGRDFLGYSTLPSSSDTTWSLSDKDAASINSSGLIVAKGIAKATTVYLNVKYVENGKTFEAKTSFTVKGLDGELASTYGCDKDQKVIAYKNIESGRFELLESKNCGTRWARTITKTGTENSSITIDAYSTGGSYSVRGYGDQVTPMVFDYRAYVWGKIEGYLLKNYILCG